MPDSISLSASPIVYHIPLAWLLDDFLHRPTIAAPIEYFHQCDCWVTSYPDYRFGNILECDSLSELLSDSGARQRFVERPVKLMQGGLYSGATI